MSFPTVVTSDTRDCFEIIDNEGEDFFTVVDWIAEDDCEGEVKSISELSKEKDEEVRLSDICWFRGLEEGKFWRHIGDSMISVSPEEGGLLSWRQELYSDSQAAVWITFWGAVFIESIFDSVFQIILFDISRY